MKTKDKFETMNKILGIMLLTLAMGLLIVSFYINGFCLKVLILFAAIDLFSTVILKRPIIKAGPIAKFLYK